MRYSKIIYENLYGPFLMIYLYMVEVRYSLESLNNSLWYIASSQDKGEGWKVLVWKTTSTLFGALDFKPRCCYGSVQRGGYGVMA